MSLGRAPGLGNVENGVPLMQILNKALKKSLGRLSSQANYGDTWMIQISLSSMIFSRGLMRSLMIAENLE
jgi:hypothetical protein